MPDRGSAPGDLTHIIITRFNVRYPGIKTPKADSLGLDPRWLAGRFALFETYCLPSLIAQSDQDFVWWIYLDSDTPLEFILRAQRGIAGHRNIVLKLCDVYADDLLVRDISASFPSAQGWLLTTRLDNDDGLHPDFVKCLHREIRFEEREALNFPLGIVIREGRTYLHRHESNAFLSLAEAFDGFVTVLSIGHMNMRDLAPIRQIDDMPGWLQVVHGANLSNKVRGHRIPRAQALAGFTWLAEAPSASGESATSILIDNAVYGAWRRLRDTGIRIVRWNLRVGRRMSLRSL